MIFFLSLSLLRTYTKKLLVFVFKPPCSRYLREKYSANGTRYNSIFTHRMYVYIRYYFPIICYGVFNKIFRIVYRGGEKRERSFRRKSEFNVISSLAEKG